MSKILIGLTGSIACFKVAGLISDLVKEGHEVRTMASASALKFIGNPTLEGLSGQPVITDLFASGANMEHIHLGRWANVFLIAPCTANTMAKIRHGLADDLITTTALAFEKNKKIFIAPAMNKEMWSNPATEESRKALQDRGFHFIDPEEGELACGEIGNGRLASVDRIKNCLFQNSNKKILITGGGTRESIDGVRFIGNSSTGKTSQTLADELRSMGNDVELLMAQKSFSDYESLKNVLKNKLQTNKYDVVIHAAAVSDFTINKVSTSDYDGPANKALKLKTGDQLKIEMKPNPKLLNHLKEWSQNPNIQVVGFKLTQTQDQKERIDAIQKIFSESQVDYVVHNDLNEINGDSHPFRIIKNDRLIIETNGASALAHELSEVFGGPL